MGVKVYLLIVDYVQFTMATPTATIMVTLTTKLLREYLKYLKYS